MAELLQDHAGCEVIKGDVLILGKTSAEHDTNLNRVLATIDATGLKLNKEKCHIRKKQLNYFGRVVGPDIIKASTEKVIAMTEV